MALPPVDVLGQPLLESNAVIHATRILLAGDLVWDYNLVKTGESTGTYSEPIDATVLSVTPGGAWFLRQIIEAALKDIDPRPQVVMAVGDPPMVIRLPTDATKPTADFAASAFTVWAEFPIIQNPSDTEKGKKAWRVTEFLGCNRAEAGVTEPPPSDRGSDAGLIVVLEDLGLGFGVNEKLWPQEIRDGQPAHVILKLSSLVHENKLFKHLLENHRDRLTVVVYADELRRRGAVISKGLSWDRTKTEIVQEFTTGLSANDLAKARCVVIAFGLEGVTSFTRCDRSLGAPGSDPDRDHCGTGDCIRQRAVFERLLFCADEAEGAFRRQREGRMFGAASILTAAVVRHVVDSATYPLFIALGRGMQAARDSHHAGAAINLKSCSGAEVNLKLISKTLHPDWTLPMTAGRDQPTSSRKTEPADTFHTAFPHYVVSDEKFCKLTEDCSNLLQDLAGAGSEAMTALSMAIVMLGAAGTLRAAPKAKVGSFLTVDCEEIERINALRNLFATYLNNPKDERPLSIAVFGQPGSGKSFAIKELAQAIFPQKPVILEFNLSQFPAGEDELHKAFHRVRDASVKRVVPVVFWDEFDTERLKWLKYFLAPMWDAEFRSGSVVHPLGKCIFVFAGGTAAAFEDFIAYWNRPEIVADSNGQPGFKSLKGPDFVSRLSGYLNIKGPNPSDFKEGDTTWSMERTQDPEFVIRRALLLRSFLERFYPQLLDGQQRAQISTGIVRALLHVKQYLHGARSLETVLRMSRLEGARFFAPSQLPIQEQLQGHVGEDFLKLVAEGDVDAPVIEVMARAVHEAWMAERESNGYIWGEQRNDFSTPKTHPLMKPYDQLSEAAKEGNRRPAREIRAKMAEVGVTIQPLRPGVAAADIRDLKSDLVRAEHDRWLREKLLSGYAWAGLTNDDLRLHRDLARYDDLPLGDESLDVKIVNALVNKLTEAGYGITGRDQGPRSTEPSSNAISADSEDEVRSAS